MLNRVKIVAVAVAAAVALSASVMVAVLTVWESAPSVEPVVQVAPGLQGGASMGEQVQPTGPETTVREAIDTEPPSGSEYDVAHPEADPLHPEVLLSGSVPSWRDLLPGGTAPSPEPARETAAANVVNGSQEVSRGLFRDKIYRYPATLEEMVIKADIIARVRLLSVNPAGARSDPVYTSDAPIPEGLHIGSLAYRLDVLEYLKGEISTTTITAYAYGWNTIKYLYATTTVAGAEQLGRELRTTRDTRWDDREAIVLLRYNAAEQHHYMGLVGVERGTGYYDFTVASPMWKSWLPAAAAPTSSLDPHQIPPGPQRFLLDDPADYPTSSAVPTATLASLRETVQSLLRELAGGDGSQAYRDCVVYKYELHSQAAGSGSRDPTLVEMLSGMPAGTRVLETGFTEEFEAGRFPDLDPSFWSAGPDRDVLLGAWPAVLTTARPLPAGKYNAWLRGLSAKERICGDPTPKAWRKVHEMVLTVTAPAGTLAESFFDPYASSTAIIGTTTVGTISWQPPSAGSGQTGRVTADLDIDATGHVLDLIALDGTTTLSLVVADATRTDGTLSWSVPTQPWSGGDMLMLRIRRSDALSSNTAAQPQPGSTEISEPAIGFKIPSDLFYFTASLEEMVLKADVIARVRLRSVEPAGARMAYDYTAKYGLEYAGSLKLTMNALEYIKGTGGAELVAYAYGYREGLDDDNEFVASTEADATELGRRLLATRDDRWDDREAIVLLRSNEPWGHYYLGLVDTEDYRPNFGRFRYQFTVAGTMWRSWLPDASPPSATSTVQSTSTADNLVSAEQRFLLDDPGSAPASTVPVIGLDELKAKVAELTREYDGGDGSAGYRACVIAKYEWETRSQQETRDNGGTPIRAVYDHELGSGKPSGIWIYFRPGAHHSLQKHGDTFPPEYGQYWTEGRDKTCSSATGTVR